MKKKGSLSLSENAIVILILAIVMLGLGLGFIRGMFGKVSTQLEQQVSAEPEPATPYGSSPITLSREILVTRSGNDEILKVSAYNPSNEVWTSASPKISCNGITISDNDQQVNPRTVLQGEFTTFAMLITIPSGAPNAHLCNLFIDGHAEYAKDLTIKIVQ